MGEGPDPIPEILSRMFTIYEQACLFPTMWKRVRIQPVPKKGDLSRIENHRPISLTEVPRKVYEAILLPWLVRVVEPLSMEQGGFRQGRGTLDQIATLQEWIVQSKRDKRNRHMAFLDIKAAYDSVDRQLLWSKCRNRGVPLHTVQMLQSLFDTNEAFVAIAGHRSRTFPLRSGVLQGSLLSPLLYSVFIDDLVEALSADGVSDSLMGGRPFRGLLYADDIVLATGAKAGLDSMLRVCEKHSIDNRYRFNAKKCEVVTSQRPSEPNRWRIYSEVLPINESFCYLGCTLTANGIDWDSHWKRLRQRALYATAFFEGMGCHSRGFGLEIGLSIYRTFIRPIMEYGLALCPATKLKIPEQTHQECLTRLSGGGSRTSALTTGMFLELLPVKVRHEKLSGRWALRTFQKSEGHAVHYAFRQSLVRRLRESCFYAHVPNSPKPNELVRRWHRLQQPDVALLPEAQRTRMHAEATWPHRCEELVQHLVHSMSSLFIVRRSKRERRKFRRALFQQPKEIQRGILLWVCNRVVGVWRACTKCEAKASKSHVEVCLLGLSAPRHGPSRLEDRLATTTSPSIIQLIGEKILHVIERFPYTTRPTRPSSAETE